MGTRRSDTQHTAGIRTGMTRSRRVFRRVPGAGTTAQRLLSLIQKARIAHTDPPSQRHPWASRPPPWRDLPQETVEHGMTLVPDPGPSDPPDMPGQGHIPIPGAERMRGRRGPGTPVGARRLILHRLYDPKPEQHVPPAHWGPADWFRMDHKYGAGYPQVWDMESMTRAPERPYLLRLDLARLVYEMDGPVEERFVHRSLEKQNLADLTERLAPSFERIALAPLVSPVAQAGTLPWISPPPALEIPELMPVAARGDQTLFSTFDSADQTDGVPAKPRGDGVESPGGNDHG